VGRRRVGHRSTLFLIPSLPSRRDRAPNPRIKRPRLHGSWRG
jgi:hypothetical protein